MPHSFVRERSPVESRNMTSQLDNSYRQLQSAHGCHENITPTYLWDLRRGPSGASSNHHCPCLCALDAAIDQFIGFMHIHSQPLRLAFHRGAFSFGRRLPCGRDASPLLVSRMPPAHAKLRGSVAECEAPSHRGAGHARMPALARLCRLSMACRCSSCVHPV